MSWMRLHGTYRRFHSPQALLAAAADTWEAVDGRGFGRVGTARPAGCRNRADVFYAK